ncbi:hypothetical protein [Novacetimonas hansenii]|uniref:hypothetical protein n=1 Tax=Novacetimonas hansenii TaxID=436 RepID=UPI000AFA603D|nr:hypothetical protein [Novacetimonas hansenii]
MTEVPVCKKRVEDACIAALQNSDDDLLVIFNRLQKISGIEEIGPKRKEIEILLLKAQLCEGNIMNISDHDFRLIASELEKEKN